MVRNLPQVSPKDLPLWDPDREVCGGFLNKKASQTSTFSKGKWQKRWFVVNLEVDQNDNYVFEYYHNVDDKQPSKSYPLQGATIKISSDTSFVIAFQDGTSLSLSVDNSDGLRDWTTTLEQVITMSNMRERMMERYESGSDRSGDDNGSDDDLGELDGAIKPKKKRIGMDSKGQIVQMRQKEWPTLRVDHDISTIPPGTIDRHRFVEMFCADIANALGVDAELVEVISLKPAPGMDWLCLVEFDINLWSADLGESENEENEEQLARKRATIRKELLENLFDMVNDSSSTLYNGYITSKVDPSFIAHILDDEDGDQGEFEIFSSDPEIMKIMNKYKDIHVPESFDDEAFFTITLYFEGRIANVKIPNPNLLTKRYCALWPFEVKIALGFYGTMQELWIEPSELVPRDTTLKALSKSIPFSASVRLGGQKVINAIHLKPDGHYDVKCDDQRDEALNSLSKEEMDEIKEIFQKCDLDGDGGISKLEMEDVVRMRTQERKALIEKKFKKYVSENNLNKEEISALEVNKIRYLQQLQEAQARILKMFEAADLNGDGIISFTEFILAEAWWLRCTINPAKAHLF